MKQIIGWLQSVGLRKIITVLLVTLTFLVVPAFSYNASLQAQATTLNSDTGEANPVTSDTVKRIQEKAEDLGDSSERPIGQTGLKNIRKLGENIPETVELKARQTAATFNPNEPNKKEAMEKAQAKVQKK